MDAPGPEISDVAPLGTILPRWIPVEGSKVPTLDCWIERARPPAEAQGRRIEIRGWMIETRARLIETRARLIEIAACRFPPRRPRSSPLHPGMPSSAHMSVLI
ncbi:MAG: hypothetical protein U0359_19845 [Byssovorax sp.]